MAVRPVQGGSNNTWGAELNTWLDVAHASDGNLRVGSTIGDASGLGNSPALSVRQDYTATPASGTNQNTLQVKALARGAWSTEHMLYNVQSMVADSGVTANKTVTNAVNNGGLIRLTVTGHGYTTGDRIIVDSVGGTVEANGSWLVTAVDANTLDLQGSAFVNAYTSGGITTNRPGYHAYLALVAPAVARGGLTGANVHADDVAGFFVSNNGTAKATDAYYVGNNTGIAGSEWATIFSADADADYGIRLNGTYANYGIDLNAGTYTAGAIRLKNNSAIVARNQAGDADVSVLKLNTANQIEVGAGILMVEGKNLVFGTTSGTKLGTATSQKIGFWNALPVVQQTVTGSRGANAALASLLTALATIGLVVDSSSA